MTLVALALHIESANAQSRFDSHEVITMSLRRDMIGKARMNGQIVTNVILKGQCLSGFVTRSGVTWIDWTKAYNGFPSGLHGNLILKIPQNGTFDVITYTGSLDVADGIIMSTGVLGLDCYKRHAPMSLGDDHGSKR